MGIRSNALSTSSTKDKANTPLVIEGQNGIVQVSKSDDGTVGLLIERSGRAHGLLLTSDQVEELIAALS